MKKLLLLLAIISSFVACGNAQKQTETAATKTTENTLEVLYFTATALYNLPRH